VERAHASTRRLFVGLRVASDAAGRVARRVRPALIEGGGAEPDGLVVYAGRDLHLTLCFLGALGPDSCARLAGVLQEEVRGLVAPDLWLSDTGGFPSLAQPRVLWAGVREAEPSCGRLGALHNRVLQAALSIGWRPGARARGRPFAPHVTLARVRAGGPRIPPAFGRMALDERWLPLEVELMESCPDGQERYRTLASVPLVVQPG
jgi:2'-5' RNA ligase